MPQRLAGHGQHHPDIRFERTHVRQVETLTGDRRNHFDDHVQLGTPPTVDGGLADAGPAGNAFDRHPPVSERGQFLEHGDADGLGDVLAQDRGTGRDPSSVRLHGRQSTETLIRMRFVRARRGDVRLIA